MILTINDLPSNGKFGHAAPIHLRPLNFMEILNYTNDVAGTSIKSYLKDITWITKMSPNILQHSLYDLDYIIFMMKVHTISDNKEFQSTVECEECGTKINLKFGLQDFKFIDIEDGTPEINKVLLNNYKYSIKIPTIGEFLEVLRKYNLYKKVDSVDIVKLISLFPEFKTMPNDIERDVLGATRDEVTLLYLLESKYLNSVKPFEYECTCNDKRRGKTVGIQSLIVDMFRNVLLNNPADEYKIQSGKDS